MKMTACLLGGVLAALLAVPVRAAAPEDWAVKEAPIRFALDLTVDPSHPSAGYFVTLPDGGILPGPAPDPMVFDEAGTRLTSAVLWHCPETGCGLVFETPKTKRSVVVYVSATSRLKVWTPQSGLTPSALFCVSLGSSTLNAATRLGNFGSVGPMVQYVNKGWAAGQWKSERIPLAMWWDTYPGGVAMYMLAHVNVTDPGATWVAPVLRQGAMDVAIDGQPLRVSTVNEKMGGTGGSINLTPGIHRVELYGYNFPGGGEGGMMLTWRPPKTKAADLGGLRPKERKYPGTPFFESRVITDNDVIKSGAGEVRNVQARDGGPIASFTVTSRNVYWFAGEDVLVHCLLSARTEKNPAGTRYSWKVDGVPGALASGTELNWIFKAIGDCGVTLTAETDGKRSSCHIVFRPQTDIKSSLEDPSTREAFRSACLAMLKAHGDKSDPAAKWDVSMWNNFFRVLDLQAESGLIEYLVTQQWDFFRKKLDAEKKATLEDLFLVSMASRKPKEAVQWAAEFAKDAPSHTRSVMLQLKSAEILMYYLGDLEGARKIIAPLVADDSEGGEWAKIRLGDLELLSHNLNEATQRYGDVQNRSKAGTGEAAATTLRAQDAALSGPMKSADFARLRAPKKAGGKPTEEAEPPSNVAYWKLAAIRDVAASEKVSSLIDQEFYLEAFKAMKAWERSFPLNKITGDYIQREAKFYMALKDYKRARVILAAYCDQVDTSNFLPEAMQLIKKCMILMNEPEAEVAKYEKAILKRTQAGGGED